MYASVPCQLNADKVTFFLENLESLRTIPRNGIPIGNSNKTQILFHQWAITADK